MIYFLISLLFISQPAASTGSSHAGYVSDDSSDVTDDNGLSSDTLESMPVSDIMEVVERQSGILNSGIRCGSIKFFSGGTQNIYYIELSTLDAGIESHLHMRGGRSSEVIYIVDGVIHRNPINGGFISSIPFSSIREVLTISGNHDAQYGNAQSGIVEIETFEGGSSYHGGISISGNDWQALGLADDWTWGGDDPAEPGSGWKWSNVSSSSEARLEFGARIGGPEPLTSYLLPEIGIEIPGDLRIFADGEFLQTGGGDDGRYGYGFDEWESAYTGIIKLTYDPAPSTRIDLSTSFLNRTSGWFGVGDYWAWSRYEVPYINTDTLSSTYGDTLAWGRSILYGLPTRFWNNSSIGLLISHTLSDETSVQLGIGQYKTSFDFKIRNDPESTDPMRQTEWLGEGWSWNDWQNYEVNVYTDPVGFIRSGTSRFPWNESRSTTTTVKADIKTMISSVHTLGAGIDGSYYDIFSYDIIANSSNVNLNRYSAFPNSGGVYLQDRIVLDDGFVMNAGVRLDYFDANYDRTSDPLEIAPPSFQRDVLNKIEAPLKYSINPRLSFYCPVSERETLHFTYGVHSQIPALGQMYRQADYSFSEETPLGGNPDLDFERNVQYEIGLTHRISDDCMIDITGYVKSISNLVETELYSLSPIGDYALYTNGGYGESKGLEITFNGHPDGFFSWNVSYILSKSTGTSSHALQNYLYSLYYGFSNADTDQYLDWDQLHTVYADLDLYVPRGRGFRIAGVPVFQGLGVHLSWSFGSGFPYTHAYQAAYEPRINEGMYPATNTASLKINKAFWFSDMTLDAWCEVTNLFNRQNIDNIEDIAWYDAWYQVGGGSDRDPTGALDNHYAFSRPRMIRFGLGLNW